MPPHLVTIFPNVASTSLYHNWVTLNGVWRLSFNLAWGSGQESRVQQNMEPHSLEGVPVGISYDRALWHLPLVDMPELLGRHPSFWRDWVGHPDYDEYWKTLNAEEVFDKIGIPVHTFGGWFDIFSAGTLNGYVGMSQRGKTGDSRDKSHMIIGPWGHGPTRKFGDLDFGEDAFVDRLAVELHWFDYWLKGIDNGAAQERPVKLFTMGRNVAGSQRVSVGRDSVQKPVFLGRRQGQQPSRRRSPFVGYAARPYSNGSVYLRSEFAGAEYRRQPMLWHSYSNRAPGSAPG